MALPDGEVMYGTLDLLVLKTLQTLGPMHGYAIADRLQQISDKVLTLNQGTLYPALLRLEQRHWIRSKWGTTENKRKARYYSITIAGRAQMEREQDNWNHLVALMNRVLRTV